MHRVKLHKFRERASIDVQAEQFSELSRSGETLKVRLVKRVCEHSEHSAETQKRYDSAVQLNELQSKEFSLDHPN